MAGHTFDEVESGLVPSCKDVGYTCPRNSESVGELRLTEALSRDELLQTLVHILNIWFTKVIYKINTSKYFTLLHL